MAQREQVTVKTENEEDWLKINKLLKRNGISNSFDTGDTFKKFPVIFIDFETKRYINVSYSECIHFDNITPEDVYKLL